MLGQDGGCAPLALPGAARGVEMRARDAMTSCGRWACPPGPLTHLLCLANEARHCPPRLGKQRLRAVLQERRRVDVSTPN